MSQILVLYSTNDGQTQHIAERVGKTLESSGHSVTLLPADAPTAGPAIYRNDAVVLGAAIRFGHHSRALETFTKAHVSALSARRNAFFSVCLCAGSHDGAKPEAARRYVEEFCTRTGWHPNTVASFAGALRYSKYNPVIRTVLRFIMLVNGGETDADRDYEYTDWEAVDRFAKQFAAGLAPTAAAAAA